MPVILASGTVAKNAFVFWGSGTAYTSNGALTGYPSSNTGLPDTYSSWRSPTDGDCFIRLDRGASRATSAIGIAAHNLASSGVSQITVARSTNGTDYTTISTIALTSDEDIIVAFTSVNVRYIRVSWTGPAANIGVFQAGARLDFQCPAVLPYTPIQHSIQYQKEFNNSVSGHFLTNRVIAKGASTEVSLMMQTPNFVEVAMRAFEVHYNQGGCFFYAGSPMHMADDMGYCQAGSQDDIVGVEYIEAGTMANVSFSLNVYRG